MARQAERSASHHGGSAWAVIFAAGFCALVSQALLFREFLSVFEGNELGLAWFFTTWLLWVAVGALLGRLRVKGLDALTVRFEFLVLLYLPAYLLQGWLIRSARDISGVEAYELFPIARMLPASIVANAPISFLTGLLFALACKWISRGGRIPVATVYICETVGSCAGGVAVTVLLYNGASGETVFLVAALVLSVAFLIHQLARRRWLSAAIPLIAVLAVHATGLDHAWRRANDLRTWQRLFPPETYRGSFVTPQAKYLYGEQRGQMNIVAWESIAASIPNTEYASSVAALHLAQRPGARRFLVVGQGGFALCRRLLVLPQTESVTWLDHDPAYPAHLLRILPDRLKLTDARLAIPRTDLRTHLLSTRDRYDVAILGLPDATTLTLNRYFTREFFELLRARLAVSGLVGLRVSGGENFMGEELINVGASVFRTLGSVFQHLVIKPGEESWFLASDDAGLTTSPAILRDRFQEIDGSEALYPAEGLMSLYLPDRIAFQEARYHEAVGARSGDVLLNTDRHPRALFHSLQFAAREAGTAVSLTAALRTFAACGRPVLPITVVLYGILRFVFILKRRKPGAPEAGVVADSPFDGYFLVFSTGAAAMAFSIILMFMYQSVFGSIFLYAGLISALFMLGLSMGSLATGHRIAKKGKIGRGTIAVIMCLHAGLMATVVRLPFALPRGAFAVLFLLSGLFGGIYVPLVAAQLRAAGISDRAAGGVIELSDHLGGAVGSLITGLVLLPVFGNAYALGLVALILLVNLLPMLLRSAEGRALLHPARRAATARAAGYIMVGAGAFLMAVSLCCRRTSEPALQRQFERAAQSMAGRSELIDKQATLRNGQALAYYEVANSAGDVESYLFSTDRLAPAVLGYGGAMTLAVMLDPEGTLHDFRIIRSNETPAYLALLNPWMQEIQGRGLFDANALADVDAVTGATLSSAAIRDALRTAGNTFAREVLNLGIAGPDPRPVRRAPDTRFFSVIILAVMALILRNRPHRRLRQLFLLLVLTLCGLLLNTQYSLAQTLSLLALQLPPAGWSAVFVLVLVLPFFVLLFGNVYCGYLCPFGALQELVGDLRPAQLDTHPATVAWRYGRPAKFLLLFLVVAAFALSLDGALASHDPLVSVFSSARSRFVACIAGVVLLLSFFYPRFWCRTLCPTGAFLALLNGTQFLKRLVPRVNHKLCPFGVTSDRDLDCICCDRCRMTTHPEREALKAARERLPSAGRCHVFLLGVAVLAATFIWRAYATWSGVGTPAPGAPGIVSTAGGQPRDVDMLALRRKIDLRQLSDQEAKYYKPVDIPLIPPGGNAPKEDRAK